MINNTNIIIFGSTGDLAKRKLFPAFYNLLVDGRMPEKFNIIALGRSKYDNEQFRNYIKENIENFSRRKTTPEEWSNFEKHIIYLEVQISEADSYVKLNSKLDDLDKELGERANRLFYLSVGPNLITTISKEIKKTALASIPEKDRIIIEKPFGYNKQTAIELNNLLTETFEEKQIYRIDHYLGKETVQNLLSFRFSNAIFEPLWNNKYIDYVQITVAEEVGVEARGNFYDKIGALKDMVQNHLLQILCLVAMEAPDSLEPDEIRIKKVDALKAIRRISLEEVNDFAVRGQYSEGEIKGALKVGYRQEEGIMPESNTESFVALKFFLDNERWQDVPFYIRTGKRLEAKQSYIAVQFKPISNLTFSESKENILPNKLMINIQPSMDIKLQIMAKKQGLTMHLRPVEMIFDYFTCKEHSHSPEAYETLLLEAILGDLTLFMRSDQVEEAWDVISTIQENWESTRYQNFPNYKAGSMGPKESFDLVEKEGHTWL